MALPLRQHVSTDSSSETTATPSSKSSPPVAPVVARSRNKDPNRHRKTRNGCYHCKRRRIKCQETRPACRNCVKSGYTCEYPTQIKLYQAPDQVPRFTMMDMHFFQHFLLQSHPLYPLGNETVWKHEVLCLAQQHEFLLYAVLGFAAADLRCRSSTSTVFSVPAMTYRVKAIQLFRKAIVALQEPSPTVQQDTENRARSRVKRRHSKTISSSTTSKSSDTFLSLDQGSALVASCYLLMGQSNYIEDGLQDFMTFTRGSISLRQEMRRIGFPPLFQNLEEADSVDTMRRYLENVPPLDEPWLDTGETALEMLKTICHNELQFTYLEFLERILSSSRTNTFQVYEAIMGHFIWWGTLPFEQFQSVIDLSDQVNILLATHWISLHMVMAFLSTASVKVNDDSKPASESSNKTEERPINKPPERWFRWLVCLNGWVNEPHALYNSWPQWVQRMLQQDGRYFHPIS